MNNPVEVEETGHKVYTETPIEPPSSIEVVLTFQPFALQDKAIRQRAQKKLEEKNLDMIIANTPAAIGAETSKVHIKTPTSKWTKIGPAEKSEIAKKIIALIQNM